jgi:hypothetical protein
MISMYVEIGRNTIMSHETMAYIGARRRMRMQHACMLLDYLRTVTGGATTLLGARRTMINITE